ncbi:hypothetical protein CW357_12880 [Rummeliibacillus sp. TYF005]|uniref:hypothetical protein n=1 Tax=Rummeliibacillus sp. TYF005 TaxID=2058214 RepID=UPI000F545864|nr:hypothetical protein [Rummeliibacillus sp. TYF005]RPJ94970.1 hypothetical protein CW357_12880 [Rummeliibacillus sp. TYF005]
MKKCILICILLFAFGCSNKEDKKNSSDTANDTQIENQQKEIQKLKVELKEVKDDYSVHLQQFDGTSRNIMWLITDGKYEEIKRSYNVGFEVKDGKIIFALPKNVESAPFLIKQAKLPMSIAYFNREPESTEIGYYLDDLKNEERYLISVLFDNDGKFKYILVGDT